MVMRPEEPMTRQSSWREPTPTPLEQILLGEFTHRMANDFSVASSAIRLRRPHVADSSTIRVLDDLLQQLEALSRMQRLLLCPPPCGSMELGLAVRELCEAICEARLAPNSIALGLELGSEPIPLASPRAWRILLILTELLTNAARHGSHANTRQVRISLAATACDIMCSVVSPGSHRPDAVDGYGARVVKALVSELDGSLEARADGDSTEVRLVAPRLPLGCIVQASDARKY